MHFKATRLSTLVIGLIGGILYALLVMVLVTALHKNVSIGYIFVLPVILGAIPVLFSTQEQLQSYKVYILLPWGIVLGFFALCYASGYEGMICLVVIVGPFLLLGSLGAFIFRLIRLKREGKQTRLYAFLLLPLLVLFAEDQVTATDDFEEVKTSILVDADPHTVWTNIKNVKDIQPWELQPHFIHFMGIPRPLDGRLDKEGIGGVRHITWEKGIRFREIITQWDEGTGFRYNIEVDPASIPPTTLDEHVLVGGQYFDVVAGSYQVSTVDAHHCKVTLTCRYRVTTTLNSYSKLWANFILSDFNTMILQVIKGRCEAAGE